MPGQRIMKLPRGPAPGRSGQVKVKLTASSLGLCHQIEAEKLVYFKI